tara:strand:+ start:639 stop:2990 length:2352 start_codon:yes stop_codon:yes gene_type:complete
MASDVNKSVEITLRANLKQLQSSLAQIPSMTKKEASQMTRALASEFKKAQKAANKAASESKKAAEATAKAYAESAKKTSQSFRSQSESAKKASKEISDSFDIASSRIRETRKQSRDMGAALGSLEDVVSAINPELATMAAEIGAAGQAARSFSRSLATGNLVLMGIVATLAIAAVGYTVFTSKQREASESFNKFIADLESGENQINQLAQEIEGLSRKITMGFGDPERARIDALYEERKLRRELGVLQGTWTENEKEVADIQDKSRKQISEIQDRSKSLRDLAEERREKAQQRLNLLDEEYRDLFEIRKQLGLGTKERFEADKKLREILDTQSSLREVIQGTSKTIKDINEEEKIRIARLQSSAKIETEISKAKDKQKKRAEAIERAEKRRQKVLSLSAEINESINALERESETLSDSLLSKEEQIKNTARDRRDALDGELESLKAKVDRLKLTAKTEEEILFAQESAADLQRASEVVAKSKQSITEQEQRDLDALNEKTEKLIEKQKTLSRIAALRVSLEDKAISAYLDALPASKQLEAQEIKLAIEKQNTIDKINAARDASLASAKTQEELDLIEKDRKRAIEAAEMLHEVNLQKLRKKGHKEQMDQMFAGSQVFLNGINEMTTASLELLQKSGNKNKKLIAALFLAQKTAAIGEIVMNTAKSITAAPAQFGALAPVAIAGYVATAAAQTAIVMSQQPPKFHMGGMIEKTPDERVIVVKQGEAILDRATVNRLGDQGVSRLQNGQSMSPEVIVMNPYKHFDRFVGDRSRAGLSTNRARRGY